MAGRRLLDAIALVNASRAVASMHLSLRLKQLEVFTRTSALARAVSARNNPATQARVSAISQRNSISSSRSLVEQIPTAESVQTKKDPDQGVEGLEQDHHYQPGDNAITHDVPKQELRVKQRKATRYPLPDGTIPSTEDAVVTVEMDQDVQSQRSPTEPVKKPLEQHESGSAGLEPKSSCESSIPNPDIEPSGLPALSSEDAKDLQRQPQSQISSTAAEPPVKNSK